jgi:hypothetical protein
MAAPARATARAGTAPARPGPGSVVSASPANSSDSATEAHSASHTAIARAGARKTHAERGRTSGANTASSAA